LVHRIRLTASLAFCVLLSSAGPAAAQDVAPSPPLAESAAPSEVALPVAVPTPEIPRDRVVEAWRSAQPTSHGRAAALLRLRLEYGLGDLRAPAQVIHAAAVTEDAAEATELARDLAPRMPALQWIHVQDLWHGGERGAAVKAFGAMLWETAHQLESQRWLLANGLFVAWIVSLTTACAFIAMLGLKAFAHAAHDLGDVFSLEMPSFARWALLASIVLMPLCVGEGFAGTVLVGFAIAFLYGKGRERGVLLMAATLWIVALHPLSQWASIATTVVEVDPITRSALAVTQGTGSRADVERLEAVVGEDLVAAHALAYLARRFGMDRQAMADLDAMAERWPADPVVLANRANIEMRAGNTEPAMSRYERAATQIESATLLFDLSQAYATVFRMEEYETSLARAQRIDDREVQALSRLSDSKLVADLAFPLEILRDRMRARGLVEAPSARLAEWIAPGLLGAGWSATAIGFAVVVLAGWMLSRGFDRSSACTRCGHRICSRCESAVWSDELCDGCHHLFKNPESTDAKLRMARLHALSIRESRIHGLTSLGSIVVPGFAGLASRRPDRALLGLALFAWIVTWVRWPAGVLVDPLWLGALAPLLFTVLGGIAVIGYVAIVAGGLVAIRNR